MQQALYHLLLAFSIVFGTVFIAIEIGLKIGDILDKKRIRNHHSNS